MGRRFRFGCIALLPALVLLSQVAYAAPIQVTLQDTSISPSVIRAPQGQRIDLNITNRGSKTHNFVLKDFYVFTQNLKPGEQVSVSFTPDKTGSFPYISDTGGRPEPGLRGTLIITP